MDERFEIFYIRHGDTAGMTADGRKPCDIGLSPLGERQAELLCKRLSGMTFDAVFSSPLVRAVKTAEIACKGLDLPIEIMPELIEKGTQPGYGEPDFDIIKSISDKAIPCPDRIIQNVLTETDEENRARSKKVTEYFRSRFTYGQRILVFAHGSLGNAFLPEAVDMPDGNYILSINNTSVSKIKYTPDGKQRLSFVNDFSHLRELMPDYELTV